MPARRRKAQEEQGPAQELCGEHFPYGLGDQPEDATQVSCAHGSWNVADLKDDPEDPEDPDPDAGKSGQGSGGNGEGAGK